MKKTKKILVFVVVGRLGMRLTKSKIAPFVNSSMIRKVFVFSEKSGIEMPKTTYITHPKWAENIRPGFLKKIFRYLYEPLQLLIYTFKYRPDLINGVFTLPKGLYSLISAKLGNSKSMVSIIGGVPEIHTYSRFKRFWKWLNFWIYRNSDIVTTKGNMIKNYIINNGISNNKVIVFNGAIDIDEFNSFQSSDRTIDILFVGEFSELKGPNRVINIIEKLIYKYGMKDISAVFLGKGQKIKEISTYIHRNDLQKNIQLLGYSDKIPEYLNRAKLLIMPSISEGLSTTMLEAMSSKCVPIVSDVGNMTDAAHHNKNSFVVKSYDDIEMFAEYANKLLANERQRLKFALNGEKLVEDHYSINAQTRVVDSILSKFI